MKGLKYLASTPLTLTRWRNLSSYYFNGVRCVCVCWIKL